MRLSPQQRLQAFLQHCQLMAALHRGGKALRAAARRPP
jgi:hypothetical protein